MSEDKKLYGAEDAAFGGHYGMWKTFRKWLNHFMTKHGLKPNDIYVYKDDKGHQFILECINIVEAILSTSDEMHLQIKMMLETKEALGVNMKCYFGQVGGQMIQGGYFDRDPRFQKVDMKVDTGRIN